MESTAELLHDLLTHNVTDFADVDGATWYTVACLRGDVFKWLLDQDTELVVRLNSHGFIPQFDVHEHILTMMKIKWPK